MEMYRSLSLGSDSFAGDEFLQHLTEQLPGILDSINMVPPAGQVYWMTEYWARQFEAAGLDTSLFVKTCRERNYQDVISFIKETEEIICSAIERHPEIISRSVVIQGPM